MAHIWVCLSVEVSCNTSTSRRGEIRLRDVYHSSFSHQRIVTSEVEEQRKNYRYKSVPWENLLSRTFVGR